MGGVTRARQSLGAPRDPGELRRRRFPLSTASVTRTLYRAHTVGNGPWWFSSKMDGRFDLPNPEGTCYLAANPATALRERLGQRLTSRGTITEAQADQMSVSTLRVPHPHRLANTCSSRAASFGVTREIHTIVRNMYARTQEWALAFRAAGFDGIRYEARHATGAGDQSIALFGAAGDAHWPEDPHPQAGRDAAAIAGIKVVPVPRTITAAAMRPTPTGRRVRRTP
jgi:hypothetical protein